jgi:hypothetical protein
VTYADPTALWLWGPKPLLPFIVLRSRGFQPSFQVTLAPSLIPSCPQGSFAPPVGSGYPHLSPIPVPAYSLIFPTTNWSRHHPIKFVCSTATSWSYLSARSPYRYLEPLHRVVKTITLATKIKPLSSFSYQRFKIIILQCPKPSLLDERNFHLLTRWSWYWLWVAGILEIDIKMWAS